MGAGAPPRSCCADLARRPGGSDHQAAVAGGAPMIEQETRVDIQAAEWTHDAFRRVILTGEHEQVVVMTIPPGGEIGDEVHPDTDQVVVFLDGTGEAILEAVTSPVGPNDLV